VRVTAFSREGYIRGTLLLLLIGTILLMYAPLGSFPYVQDDWRVLHGITFTPLLPFLGGAISPGGSLFYRPLPTAYFSLLHALCGLYPPLFHAGSLLALILTALLVVDVGKRLTGTEVAGWGAGFLFATAATVHLDTQMWMVGTYEIGALLFALVSVALVLRGRYTASALSVAAALGCKEAAITLPVILVVIWYAAVRPPGNGGVLRDLWKHFRAHAGVFFLYAAARASGPSPFSLPASHPYAQRLTLPGVLNSVRLYAYRSVEALVPVKSADPSGHAMLTVGGLLIAAVTLVAGLATLWTLTRSSRNLRVLLALLSWATLVIILPVFAGSMHNAYYLLGALPPLSIAITMIAQILLLRLGGRVLLPAAMLVLALANAVDGSFFVLRKVGLGRGEGRHASSWDGNNHLIRKAELVRLVWKPLLALAPSVPPHTVFIFPDIDSQTFQDAAGVQTWYGDSTLRVASVDPGSRVLEGKIFLLFPPSDRAEGKGETRAEVDTGRVAVFRLASDSLVRIATRDYLFGAYP
jgi:hypothetical protein